MDTQIADLAPDFTSETWKKGDRQSLTLAEFLHQKRQLVTLYHQRPDNENVRISISNLKIGACGRETCAEFDQYFDSPYYMSTGKSTYVFKRLGAKVVIARQRFVALRSTRRRPPAGLRLRGAHSAHL